MDGAPKLTEPGVRSFVGKSLRDYHKYRDGFTSMIFNIGMLVGFIVVVSGVLYWRYRGRITPQEQAIRSREKKEYIFSKLQTLAAMKESVRPGMITNLPTWNNHPELDILIRKNV
jgi:hypothetical protein